MNNHITDFLDYFCNPKNSFEYAVMLDGDWGCGKTHFIKNYQDQSSLKFLHISLYGLSKLSEIDSLIFQKLHPVLGSNFVGVVGKILTKSLKASIKIDLDQDGESETSLSAQGIEGKLPEFLRNTNDYIMVFDDVERCQMPICELLGYLNFFVEFQGQKVILISNEKEIDTKAVNKKYKDIKEKLIGKTFKVSGNVEEAFETLYKSIKNRALKAKLKKQKEFIIKIHNCSKYENIRILKQSILDYEYFWSKLDSKIKRHQELSEKLLELFLILSIEIKKGKLQPSEIESFLLASYPQSAGLLEEGKAESFREKQLNKLHLKYDNNKINDSYLETKDWENLFSGNILDQNSINEQLLKLISTEIYPAWKKLWREWEQTDSDFENNLKEVSKNLFEGKCEFLGELLQTGLLLLHYSELKLYGEMKKNILKEVKKQLNQMPCKHFMNVRYPFHGYGNCEFWGKSNPLPEQDALWKHFEERSKRAEFEYAEECIKNGFKNILKNPREFYLLIGLHKRHQEMKKAVLLSLNVKEVYKSFLELSPEDQTHLMRVGFEERYKNIGNNDELKKEIDWINALKEFFQEEIKKREGKLSGQHFSSFVEILGNISFKLKPSTQKNAKAKAQLS